MLYKREISDQITIQYIILFVMAKANRIVTHNQLTSLVLDQCNIRFTEFRIALDNLEKIGHLRVFSPDDKETYVELLELGREANEFFYKKIPVYIREPLEDYIAPFFKEDTLKNSVTHEIYTPDGYEYMVKFKMTDGKITLMELDLYAGTKEYAYSMVKQFKKDPQKLYETIVTMVGNEELTGEEPEE